MNKNRTTPGQTIRARREALDLSQIELAVKAGVSLNTIRDIETDARTPWRSTQRKVAAVLGLKRFDLWGGT